MTHSPSSRRTQRRARHRRGLGTVSALALLSALLMTSTVGAQTVMCDGRVATIVGTPGDDRLTGTRGDDVIAGLQGDDIIWGSAGDDVICGGKGDDVLRGGADFDIIFGAQGNDELYANFGETGSSREDDKGARMFGGAGDDEIHGSNKWDRMQGGPGNDILRGYEGRDWIRGGADRDDVSGGAGIDDVHGGNGSDHIAVAGADVVKGGAGVDMCVLASEPSQLRSCGRNRPEATPRDGTVSFGPGTYLVGREAPLGFYRTRKYFQLDDSDGRTVINDFQFDDYTVAVVDERGRSIEFRTSAKRIDGATPAVNPFAFNRGRYVVGLDIAPGTYRVKQINDFRPSGSSREAAFFEFANGELERVPNG